MVEGYEFEQRYPKVEPKALGEGTYGEVWKVRDTRTGTICAMKRMKLMDSNEGMPPTAIREISLLKELQHPKVVRLMDVHYSLRRVLLVFEYVPSDLKKYMKANGPALPLATVRDFTQQLFVGMDFCHSKRVLHRDLKPQNLLVSEKGELKIADFGLARAFTLPIPKLTHEVVTVWYRAPEILLGQAEYSLPIDIWSCGCIVAEMGCGAPLFMGDSEIYTLYKIFQKLGTPSEAVWPTLVAKCPDFKNEFPKWDKKPWAEVRDLGKLVGPEGCDFLEKVMPYDPAERLSAKRALEHPFCQVAK